MKKVHLHAVTVINLGDDIFLNMIIKRYPNIKFYLFTNMKEYKDILNYKNCKVYSNKYLYVLKKIFFNFNIFNIKKNFIHISIGGSIFGEIDSKLYWAFNKFENDYKGYKKYFILGCNFGPYFTDKYLNLHHDKVFKNATDVCFREKNSYNLFKDLKNVRCRPDIVFSLDTKKYNKISKNKVVFSIIKPSFRENLKGLDEVYKQKIIEIIKYFSKKDYQITLMSFCKLEKDEEFIDEIINDINIKVDKYFYRGNINEAINEISTSQYIVATRFHAVILGILLGKKVLPIVYSDKTENVLNDLNFESEKVRIENIKDFDIKSSFKNIKKYNGNLKKIVKDSEKQFEILDKELKSD